MAAVAFEIAAPSTQVVDFGRYQDCPVLRNDRTRVVLCPQVGGRVLEYSLDGKNALFVSPYELGQPDDGWKHNPSAGRFDIGPEQIVPKRDPLFRGQWTVTSSTDHEIELTSPDCPTTGVRLVRQFSLDHQTSRLVCTQRIENISDRTVQYCHWSRTLANGAGIALLPLAGHARFPKRYVRYEGGGILTKPVDDNIRIRDGFLEVIGPPKTPKLGMDSFAGWVAHQQPAGLMFVKQYPTFPDRLYNEVAGITLSTWAPASGETVEVEPIGPAETISPGQSASFTEVWWLWDSPYPAADESVDLDRLRDRVNNLPATPWAKN
ncbi:hypothetical protein K227x_20270 [Rubripirellula lacrimiformis]|uniref:DUF4380 domain-containing protein n=2 Tax=Rubripirellula lacrimiformis TaxID=1930273 RepID=A0A517N927_9BACT|nr:hypothetical protein K227x_20270 [Rubripirellula lacrimiformis]